MLAGSANEVLLSRDRHALTLTPGQMLQFENDFVGGLAILMGVRVTDLSAGAQVLWIRGRHFDLSASAYILLPGQRCLAPGLYEKPPRLGVRHGAA